MLALHVQFTRHLITVVGEEIVIEGFVVACYAATDTGGMRGENGSNLGQAVLDVEQAKTRHPLIAMIHHLVLGAEQLLIEILHHQASGIGEHGCLVIIAVGMEAVYLIKFPETGINIVFVLVEGFKIYQDGDRLAGNVPTPNLHKDFLLGHILFPVGKKRRLLYKERARLIFPTIRTDKNDVVRHFVLKCLCPSR